MEADVQDDVRKLFPSFVTVHTLNNFGYPCPKHIRVQLVLHTKLFWLHDRLHGVGQEHSSEDNREKILKVFGLIWEARVRVLLLF